MREDASMDMEVGYRSEVAQGLVDGVVRRCRWLNWLKEG